jgi:hypothetical protein
MIFAEYIFSTWGDPQPHSNERGLKKQICRIYTDRFQKIVCACPKFIHAHLYILFNSIIFASPAKAATCKNLRFIWRK